MSLTRDPRPFLEVSDGGNQPRLALARFYRLWYQLPICFNISRLLNHFVLASAAEPLPLKNSKLFVHVLLVDIEFHAVSHLHRDLGALAILDAPSRVRTLDHTVQRVFGRFDARGR